MLLVGKYMLLVSNVREENCVASREIGKKIYFIKIMKEKKIHVT